MFKKIIDNIEKGKEIQEITFCSAENKSCNLQISEDNSLYDILSTCPQWADEILTGMFNNHFTGDDVYLGDYPKSLKREFKTIFKNNEYCIEEMERIIKYANFSTSHIDNKITLRYKVAIVNDIDDVLYREEDMGAIHVDMNGNFIIWKDYWS